MTDIVERLTTEHAFRGHELHGDIYRIAAAEITRLRAEVAALRAALRIIAGEEQCRDNLLGNSDIARIALHGK